MVAQEKKTVVIGLALSLRETIQNTNANDYAPFNLEHFRKFCRKNYVDENIEFWLAVEKFTNHRLIADNERDWSVYVLLAESIVHSFVDEKAEFQVNLPRSLAVITENKLLLAVRNRKMDTSVFDSAQRHIFELMNTDVYPKFLKEVTTDRHITITRQEALWFLNDKMPTMKEFTEYPNPVNSAETRLYSFIIATLIPVAIFMDYQYSSSILYWYLLYTQIFKMIFGPRLDIQSYLVIFLVRPIVQTAFLGWPFNALVPGPPTRFALLCGVVITLIGYGFRLGGMIVASYSVFGLFCLILLSAFILDKCLGCAIFWVMMHIGILPETSCDACRFVYVKGAGGAEKV